MTAAVVSAALGSSYYAAAKGCRPIRDALALLSIPPQPAALRRVVKVAADGAMRAGPEESFR